MNFYGQAEVDRVLYQRFFRGRRQGFFVEAGAFDGLFTSSCLAFEKHLEWTGVNIEPVPALFERLQCNRPNSINLRCALGEEDSITATFEHPLHPTEAHHFGQGSLCHTTEHRQRLLSIGCKFETYQVRVRTYPELARQHHWPAPDLFVLDVEGAELGILRAMLVAGLALPRILCVEYPFIGLEALTRLVAPSYSPAGTHHNNAFFERFTHGQNNAVSPGTPTNSSSPRFSGSAPA